jgi:hypothetical protein
VNIWHPFEQRDSSGGHVLELFLLSSFHLLATCAGPFLNCPLSPKNMLRKIMFLYFFGTRDSFKNDVQLKKETFVRTIIMNIKLAKKIVQF